MAINRTTFFPDSNRIDDYVDEDRDEIVRWAHYDDIPVLSQYYHKKNAILSATICLL